MLLSYTSIGLLTILSSIVQAHFIEPKGLERRAELQPCTNMDTNFKDSLEGWVLEGSSSENCGITANGLEMRMVPPVQHVRLMDNTVDPPLPYNKYEGRGCTFNATTYMKYGNFSVTMKSANSNGAVLAAILIGNNGDEIDWELLTGGKEPVTTNYFYGKNIKYGINGKTFDPPSAPTCNKFYTYSVTWTPEYIIWSIDGLEIRKQSASTTNGEYPHAAARLQIGLWDGSGTSSTAEWARGPIDWDQKNPVIAYIKNVKIECNAQYNQISN